MKDIQYRKSFARAFFILRKPESHHMIPLNVKQSQRIKRSPVPWKCHIPTAVGTATRAGLLGSLETDVVQLLPTLSKPRVLLPDGGTPCYHSAFAVLPGFELGRVAAGLVQEQDDNQDVNYKSVLCHGCGASLAATVPAPLWSVKGRVDFTATSCSEMPGASFIKAATCSLAGIRWRNVWAPLLAAA